MSLWSLRVTDATIRARWEFRILVQSGICLRWILNMFKFKKHSKPQPKFHGLYFSMLHHYTQALIFFGFWIWSHFLRKRDGFKEIMCFVVNLVAMGDLGFLLCSSKLCFTIYIDFKIPHGHKMSKIQYKVCKTNVPQKREKRSYRLSSEKSGDQMFTRIPLSWWIVPGISCGRFFAPYFDCRLGESKN